MEKHGGEVEKVELKYDRVTNRMRYLSLNYPVEVCEFSVVFKPFRCSSLIKYLHMQETLMTFYFSECAYIDITTKVLILSSIFLSILAVSLP